MHLQNLNGFCLVLFGCNVFASVVERIRNRKAMQINASGAIASFGEPVQSRVPRLLQVFKETLQRQKNQGSKAIARMNPDFKEGRPKKYSAAQINHARELLKTNTYASVVAMTGISRSTLKRINKDM